MGHNYSAIGFSQRGPRAPTLLLFSAPVSEITRWATVEELGPKKSGAQRSRRQAKIEAIRKFMAADERNTIPTAVIVAFAPSDAVFEVPPDRRKLSEISNDNAGVVRIRAGATGAIVDGQHRVFGVQAFDPEMALPVVAILDADRVEKAFQFLVINNKATRVPPNHTKALLARLGNTNLQARLSGARIALDAGGIADVAIANTDRESPFFKMIDWPTTPARSRIVPATAIENSLDFLKDLSAIEFEDRDVRRSVFLAMWTAIKRTWPELWVRDSRLLSKVGIMCLTRYVSQLVVSWADNDDLNIDLSDLEQIEAQTERVIQHMSPEFWKAPWAERAQGGFDTNQGRERVLIALRQLYRNGKSGTDWSTDIDIIDARGPDVAEKPVAQKRGGASEVKRGAKKRG